MRAKRPRAHPAGFEIKHMGGTTAPTARWRDRITRREMMRKLTIIATPLALALVLTGCGQSASNTAASTENAVSEGGSDVGNAIDNAADDVKEALTPTPSPQDFANTAAKSDAFEIASAKIAKDKATSPDLKMFASMMIEDHTGSTAKIKAAAAKLSPAVTPDATLTDSQNSKLKTLGEKTGADFDKEYADQQVDAHQSALSLMTEYADNGEAAGLKAVAAEIKPKVETHLGKIKAIQDALK
jgi:putative membrane protein